MKSPNLKNIFLLHFTACIIATVSSADLASDRKSLLMLRNAVGGRTSSWNTSETNPCLWSGVFCENERVTSLRLPAMGLSGNLPIGLGNLTGLQTLSLRFNLLTGPIPYDFSKLVSLRNLYLQNNFLSGEVPEFVYGLQNLICLSLANNNFSGEISSSFNNLTRLDTLSLEQNQFTGSVPDINVPPLHVFNVSYNNLTGPIPERFSCLDISVFSGNSLCGNPLHVPCPGNNNSNHKNGLSGVAIAVAVIVIGCVFIFLLILVLLVFLCRKRTKSAKSVDVENGTGDGGVGLSNSGSGSAWISTSGILDDLLRASQKSMVFVENETRKFSLDDLLRGSAEILGKGTFGKAYKVALEMGVTVAVKRLEDVTASEREFKEKMKELGKLFHEKLVALRCFYYRRDENLIVYDYMPMGSLSALLHENNRRTPLNWKTRSTIALGAAQGIAYLHSQSPTFSHGNIKSSNILLTESYESRVSDFGHAFLALPTARVSGYWAPEVTDTCKVSQKADIYSFGIMLMELITGKAPTHSLLNDEGVDLPRWVQSISRDEWKTHVFDMELLLCLYAEDEMVKLLQLALECTAQYPDKRPSMDVVVSLIEKICHTSLVKRREEIIEDLFKMERI